MSDKTRIPKKLFLHPVISTGSVVLFPSSLATNPSSLFITRLLRFCREPGNRQVNAENPRDRCFH